MTKRPAKPLPALPQLPVADKKSLRRDYDEACRVAGDLAPKGGKVHTEAQRKAWEAACNEARRLWKVYKAAS